MCLALGIFSDTVYAYVYGLNLEHLPLMFL